MVSDQSQQKPALLLVEDDRELREQMKWALTTDYRVGEAGDRRGALAVLRRIVPDVVVLDMGLPPAPHTAQEGLAALRDILQADPGIKVVVLTGQEDRAVALEAVQRGACDYVSKPACMDALRVIIGRAQYMATLEREWRESQRATENGSLCGMIGQGPGMQKVFEAIRRVAPTDVTVLITGESGTGKEMVARAIHALSPRTSKALLPIHCAAIPETLLESELFGHERGAFTGADRRQKGRLEAAEGGTILLDEVGEITPSAQVKLLRFLEDRMLERIGSGEKINVDLRILAATNRDLKAAIAAGQFREDLYYRLSVVEIPVPPLRERGEDVLLLARVFALRHGAELNGRPKRFSDDALVALQAHPWPGNVRELENRVKRAILMSEGPIIQPSDLGLSESGSVKPWVSFKEARAQLEKNLIQQALIVQNGNISKAAEDLGISRQALHDFIKKYELVPVIEGLG